MKFRKELFWDADPGAIDARRSTTYLIERIANFGTATEIRWALRQFGVRRFLQVIRTSRDILPATKRLWLDVLGRKTR